MNHRDAIRRDAGGRQDGEDHLDAEGRRDGAGHFPVVEVRCRDEGDHLPDAGGRRDEADRLDAVGRRDARVHRDENHHHRDEEHWDDWACEIG